jgi:hypothetical protein
MLVGSQSNTWREQIWARLMEHGICFCEADDDDVGIIEVNKTAYGLGRLLSLSDQANLFDLQIPVYRQQCPYLADLVPIGIIDWFETNSTHRQEFIDIIVQAGAALIASPNRLIERSTICKTSYCLDQLLDKYGFDDGDRLLPWSFAEPNDYILDAITAMEEAAKSCGTLLQVGLSATHSPFRV